MFYVITINSETNFLLVLSQFKYRSSFYLELINITRLLFGRCGTRFSLLYAQGDTKLVIERLEF